MLTDYGLKHAACYRISDLHTTFAIDEFSADILSFSCDQILLSFQHQVEINRVIVLCSLMDSLLCGEKTKVDMGMDPAKLHPLICTVFVFSYVWSLGGNLMEKSMDAFDSFCRDLFGETHDVKVGMLLASFLGHIPP